MSIIRNGLESADLDVPVVLPTLNLDFANSQSLDSRITFSRGSIGTRVNKNGLIETIPANQPRFDYDPISGECKGLLIEESRTNLLTSSNSFGASTADYGITTNATVSPDGTTNANLMYEKTTNNYKISQLYSTTVIGTTYCGSVFVKYAGSKLYGRIKVGLTNTIIINLTNGAILSSTGTCGVIPYPNGWYRIYCIWTATTISEALQIFLMDRTGILSLYQGDGTSGIYMWGAQVEEGAFPTSYIPTTSATVTRSVDNASMTGTNFSSWYNFNQGTFFTKATWPYPNNVNINYAQLSFGAGVNGSFDYFITYSDYPRFSYYPPTGGEIVNDPQGGTPISSPLNTSAFSYTSSSDFTGELVSSINGKIPVKTRVNKLSFNINAQNILRIGKPINVGNNELNGTISRLTYYPKALSPSQLQYLTQ